MTFTINSSITIVPMKKERKKAGDGETIVFPREEASRCLFVVRWVEVLVLILMLN